MNEKIHTLIVGGGQAGLSLSYYLSKQGYEHIVLEKSAQPAEVWRNQRWDSFTLVTPNWSFRMPGAEYKGAQADEYMPRQEVVQRFERYVTDFHLPVRFSSEATAVEPLENESGYQVSTNHGTYTARNVVVATGLFQKPRIPAYAQAINGGVHQLDASQYRNPQALPPGAVLVVGSGQSGCQIAEELNDAGRKVFLSTGTAGRFPRRYRGQDGFTWALRTGFLDRTPDRLPSPRARFIAPGHVTGKNGGHDLNLHQFHRDGIILLGRLRGFEDGRLIAATDLKENLANADKVAAEMQKMIDGYIARFGVNAPQEEVPLLEDGYLAPDIPALDLQKEHITVIIWACGFTFDFSLVRRPVSDEFGFPITNRGVTRFPGLYFLGMPWLHTMKSGFLVGVGEDAAHLAEQIQ
jgi:putative flavoprotein involved in K+ transport